MRRDYLDACRTGLPAEDVMVRGVVCPVVCRVKPLLFWGFFGPC